MLVVAEVALALVLLVAAGLMTRSLMHLRSVDPGFAPAGLLSVQVTLSRNAYSSPARQSQFFGEALERLRGLPGVAGAAASEYLPFAGPDPQTGFYIEGRPAPERGDEQQVHYRSVSSDYFDVMGIGLVSGRAFTVDDRADGLKVAVINEAMARMYWRGENPIGRRLALDFDTLRFFPDRPPEPNIAAGMREIVGVVKDVRASSLFRRHSRRRLADCLWYSCPTSDADRPHGGAADGMTVSAFSQPSGTGWRIGSGAINDRSVDPQRAILRLRATASDSTTTPQAPSAAACGHSRSRPIPLRKIPRTITRK